MAALSTEPPALGPVSGLSTSWYFAAPPTWLKAGLGAAGVTKFRGASSSTASALTGFRDGFSFATPQNYQQVWVDESGPGSVDRRKDGLTFRSVVYPTKANWMKAYG